MAVLDEVVQITRDTRGKEQSRAAFLSALGACLVDTKDDPEAVQAIADALPTISEALGDALAANQQ
jgi:hypothetical protein